MSIRTGSEQARGHNTPMERFASRSHHSFVSIPARTMTVTGIRHTITQPDGTRESVVVGWITRCLTCRREHSFMPSRHTQAVAATRSHSCYGTKHW